MNFMNTLPDTVMVDTVQEQLFSLMSRIRSPFKGVAKWPILKPEMQNKSQALLESQGEAAWKEAGGKIDKQGRATLDRHSLAVEEIIQNAERQYGGLLYTDKSQQNWAMRIETIHHNGKRSRVGYAISWGGSTPAAFDPPYRAEFLAEAKHTWQKPEDIEKIERDLRLYARAEQMLWLVHMAVLAQQSSAVTIPDVSLGEVVWGHHDNWPKDWRRELFATLRSLTWLHAEAFQFAGQGWTPEAHAHSVALYLVQHFKAASHVHPCTERCPLHGSNQRHGHYQLHVTPGFLGVLEKYAILNDDGSKSYPTTYDFATPPSGSEGEFIKTMQKAGRIITTIPVFKVYGPAPFSELAERERRILGALIRETTRQHNPKGPHKIHEGRVTGLRPTREVICPSLNPAETYTVFGGNGRRRGCGYRIVGQRRTGWLDRSGYDCSSVTKTALKSQVRDWLEGLVALQDTLPIIPAGLHPRTGQWYDLGAMRQLDWETLDRLHVRVYGPADCAVEIGRVLSERGGLSATSRTHREHQPARETPEERRAPMVPESHPGGRFQFEMRQKKRRQKDLAKRLGISPQMVHKLLRGGKWTPERVQQVEAWLASPDEKNQPNQLALE